MHYTEQNPLFTAAPFMRLNLKISQKYPTATWKNKYWFVHSLSMIYIIICRVFDYEISPQL